MSHSYDVHLQSLSFPDRRDPCTTCGAEGVPKKETRVEIMSEFRKLVGTTLIDLPFAAATALVTRNQKNELAQVASSAYDALIGTANQVTNGVYSSPTFGRAAGTAID